MQCRALPQVNVCHGEYMQTSRCVDTMAVKLLLSEGMDIIIIKKNHEYTTLKGNPSTTSSILGLSLLDVDIPRWRQ